MSKTPNILGHMLSWYHKPTEPPKPPNAIVPYLSFLLQQSHLTNCMRKNLASKLTQQPHFLRLLQLLINRINTLPALIPHSTQPIPSHRTRDRPGHIPHDKPHSPSTNTTNQTPKALCGRVITIRHPLLTHHILKHAAKLLITKTRPIRLILGLAAKTKRTPREPAEPTICSPCFRLRARNLLLLWVRGRGGWETVVFARYVVVSAPRGVREGVVGVVYLLEFLGAGAAFRAVGGDAIRVVFEGGFFVGVADLLL